MTKYRKNLPQLNDQFFLTDAGIETWLLFLHGLNLPYFEAFDVLKDNKFDLLNKYYKNFIRIAQKKELGYILESATWRANPNWAAKMGYSPEDLDHANRMAIEVLGDLREKYESNKVPMVISGCIGSREENFNIKTCMTGYEAEIYHTRQIQVFENSKVDMITAISMTYSDEAVGIVNVAKTLELPVVVSFVVNQEGVLPSGESLKNAIEKVDNATFMGPIYYMINCTHPSHLMKILSQPASWLYRISGIRLNAPIKSEQTGSKGTSIPNNEYQKLIKILPNLRVFGSCSVTDYRCFNEIAKTAKEIELPSVY